MPYEFELQARGHSAGPASQRGLRQPLCGRADCGNPGATPTQGLRAVPGGAWTGPWVVLGKSQARGA